MTHRPTIAIGGAAIIAACLLATPSALAGDPPLGVEVFATPSTPMYLTHAPGELNRVYIVRRGGQIDIYNLDGTFVGEFLSITVDTLNEGGLLGLAFHPDYQDNGHLFVNYTYDDDVEGFSTRIERYTVSGNPNVADPNSAHTVMEYDQPASNHNGGWIGFGPNDGYLYIASGDGGGSATGGGGRAQDVTNRLGKILRIDIDGDDFPADTSNNWAVPGDNPFTTRRSSRGAGATGDETWHFGLRNPFRCGFDRDTGDLYIADVGGSRWEEVNIQHADDAGGSNFGWNCQEGEYCIDNTNCDCVDNSDIVFHKHAYEHPGFASRSITGGSVYRGCAMPDLQGTYFFADFVTNQIWSLRYDRDSETAGPVTERTAELAPDVGAINGIVAFGEDAYGEVYIVSLFGTIYKLVPENGLADDNGNGIPDTCELEGDADGDGDVDLADLLMVLSNWGTSGPDGDTDGDGDVDLADLLNVLSNWGNSL